MDNFPIMFLSGILLISACIDFSSQKIPNLITYPSMLIGILYHAITAGIDGLVFSTAGIATGIGIFLVPYLMGGMGAGDAKLVGAVGGMIGAKGVIYAVICTAVIGGVYALLLVMICRIHFHGFIKKQMTTLWTFVLTRKYIPDPVENEQKRPRLCYGLAIAIGTGLYMFLDQSGYKLFH